MKCTKFVSFFAIASVLAVSLTGCGKQEDPKVRFMRECKESLTADECRRIADEKAFEEQQRLAMRQQQLQQPQVYTQQVPGYATDTMPPASYGQPGYTAPVPQGGSFAESAAGAVVGGVAGAVIGNALIKDRPNERQYRNTNYNQNYQQPARSASAYQQPKQQYRAPKQTTTNPTAGAFARQAPKPTVKQATYTRPATQTKPATTSRPSTSAFKR